MSKRKRCDLCDGDAQYGWKYGKRYWLWHWHSFGEGCWKQELDICDKCMVEFNTFVKSKLESL